MAGEVVTTIIGRLTDDPALKFTPSGAAVASFTVASTPREFDRETNQWKDSDQALFMRCSVWRQYAENVAETLTKGMHVMVQGRLKQRSYESNGEKRTVVELDVEDVGPTLRFATAKVTKSQRGGSGSSNGGQPGGNWGSNGQQGGVQRPGGQGQRGTQQQEPDPWATTAGARAGGYSDTPPF